FQRRTQLFAIQELHDERVAAVRGGLEIEHLDDVSVRQLLTDLKLALEALHRHVVGGDVGVQHLDGEGAPLMHVERFVNAPHTAVRHDAPNLVTLTQKLSDAWVLAVTEHGHLGGARQLLPIRWAEPRAFGVQPSAYGARFHGGPAARFGSNAENAIGFNPAGCPPSSRPEGSGSVPGSTRCGCSWGTGSSPAPA